MLGWRVIDRWEAWIQFWTTQLESCFYRMLAPTCCAVFSFFFFSSPTSAKLCSLFNNEQKVENLELWRRPTTMTWGQATAEREKRITVPRFDLIILLSDGTITTFYPRPSKVTPYPHANCIISFHGWGLCEAADNDVFFFFLLLLCCNFAPPWPNVFLLCFIASCTFSFLYFRVCLRRPTMPRLINSTTWPGKVLGVKNEQSEQREDKI